jgi:3-dehydroquinate synthase
MRKPLVLSASDPGPGRAVADAVARRTGTAVVDLTIGSDCDGAADAGRLEVALGEGSAVVLVGSDTWRTREGKLGVLERAVVVSLGDAPPDRIGAGLWAEAHAWFRDRDPVDRVAARVVELWQHAPVVVAAGSRSYLVEVGQDIVVARILDLVGAASRVVLVSDHNVRRAGHVTPLEAALSTTGMPHCAVTMEPGEPHKNVASLIDIWTSALDGEADRSSVVLAVGGGVVTDVAGFAAACFMRGVPWVACPTTLLGMVDASVGGKTGIDLFTAKNAVGAFWQPRGVVCDVAHLRTEPERGFRGALAEVVKTALIGAPELLHLLETRTSEILQRDPGLITRVVEHSVRVKASVVSRDERESGLRACLNLGHTVGHALEARGGYVDLSHGEAVSLGLVVALRLGQRRGLTPESLVTRVTRLLASLGLPTEAGPQAILEACDLLGHDKKRSGSDVGFVFAQEVGAVTPVRVGLADLRSELRAMG